MKLSKAPDAKSVNFADTVLLTGFGMHCTLKGMVLPYIKAEFAMSYTQSGLLLAATTVGFALSALLSGKLAEKVGQLKLLALCALSLFATSAMTVMASSIDYIIAAFFLSGFCYCATESLSTSVIKRFSAPGSEDRAVSSVFAFFMVGGMLAALVCYVIMRTGAGWRLAYLAAGFVCLAAALLLLRLADSSGADMPKISFSQIGKLFSNKVFMYFCLASALFSGVETTTHNWITTFVKDGARLGAAETCILLALFYASITVGRMICTRILSRVDARPVSIAAMALSLVALISLSFAGNMVLVWALTIFYGLCTSAIYPMLVSITSGSSSENMTYSGTFLAISIGNVAANSVLGVIADVFGIRATFRFDSILLAISLLIVILVSAGTGALRRSRDRV